MESELFCFYDDWRDWPKRSQPGRAGYWLSKCLCLWWTSFFCVPISIMELIPVRVYSSSSLVLLNFDLFVFLDVLFLAHEFSS